MTHTYTCEESARAINRATGWTFADIFNHYFGNGTLILVGEGENGTDIEFTATNNWLKANHCQNFDITPEIGHEMHEHIEHCSCPLCSQAKEMMEALLPLFNNGLPPGIALASVFESRGQSSRTRLSRQNGLGEEIDMLLPFFKWFINHRDFWLWPS